MTRHQKHVEQTVGLFLIAIVILGLVLLAALAGIIAVNHTK